MFLFEALSYAAHAYLRCQKITNVIHCITADQSLCVCVCTRVRAGAYVCVRVHACAFACACVCMHTSVRSCVCVCVCVCIVICARALSSSLQEEILIKRIPITTQITIIYKLTSISILHAPILFDVFSLEFSHWLLHFFSLQFSMHEQHTMIKIIKTLICILHQKFAIYPTSCVMIKFILISTLWEGSTEHSIVDLTFYRLQPRMFFISSACS